MKKTGYKIKAVLAAVAVGAVISCEGPEGPGSGENPWEAYRLMDLPWGTAINDLYMLSSTEGWAVADGPYFLRYDGKRWTIHTDLSEKYGDVEMTGMSFSTPLDGWAVGWKRLSGSEWEAFVFRYDGEEWVRLPRETDSKQWPTVYYSVHALAPDDVWLGGSGKISHFDGTGWTHYDLHINVTGLSFSSPGEGWAVGNDYFSRWNGSDWSDPYPVGGGDICDIYAPARNRAWAVGGFPGWAEIPPSFDIQYWDGNEWRWDIYVDSENPYFNLQRVRFADENDGWAVGPYAALRCDGRSWREVRTREFNPLSVFTLGGDEVWVSSYRALYKYKRLE
jgi:hypothetical protein